MNIAKEWEIILNDLDENDITSILSKWSEVVGIRKKLDELEDMLKTKIKTYLKERNWDRYIDKDTDISVTLSIQKRESIDKAQLKIMLSEAQRAQIMHTTTFEKLNIVTPETRDKLKKYVKKT